MVYRPVLKEGTIESIHAKMVLNMVQIPDKEIVMFNSLDVLDDLVPVSELSNGRTGAVLSKADRAPVIIIKRNKPSYVLTWARKSRKRFMSATASSTRKRRRERA